MKITQLRVENFKRIGIVEIEPSGPTVVVAGRNAQGKSSALDAIACALGGTRLAPQRPIRDGADSATVAVTTDDGMTITRTWTASGSTLKVENAEGMRVQSPQTWLDKRIGALSFDPLGFLRDKPADQAARLRELAGVDTRAIDAEHAATFDARTAVNRDGKALAARVEAMPYHDGAESVSTAAVLAEIETATVKAQQVRDVNAEAARLRSDAGRHEYQAEMAARQMADIAAQIDALHKRAAQASDDRSASLAAASDLRARATKLDADAETIEVPDVTPLRVKLANAETQNQKVRENADRARLTSELDAMRQQSGELSAKLAELTARKASMLAEAKMPIEGIGFGGDGVTYRGVPLSQASSAEQLRVSTAMGLAANPHLRVILIREGSLLDEDGLRAVSEMAETADAQVWVEVVGSGPAGAVVIEDGAVKVTP